MDLSSMVWRKASKSHEDGDQCVEIASNFDGVGVRDSKDPGGPKLIISHSDFRHLANALKNL